MQVLDLFESHRIPNILAAPDDSILAFGASGRLLRRSQDQGRSWSPPQEVGADAGGSALVDSATGQILVVNTGGGCLHRSGDHGRTWQREEIAVQPNAVGHGAPGGVPFQTTCSESGVALRFGARAGRLLVPGRLQPPFGKNDQEWWPYNYNAAAYSDDGGRTWQVSGPVQSGTGEGTLAELASGHIYYNSRCHMAVDHRRRIAWSYDGGHMWTDWQVADDLFEIGEPFYFKYGTKPSYGCNAGLVRVPDEAAGGREIVLFSTPDNPGKSRIRMTVWASLDGCRSWPVKRLVYEGPSAYSSLTADRRGNVYLLFERGREQLYETIAVATFRLDWLLGDAA
ncbi:MAG: sialidase family protein [Gemmatimonadota bacterium]